MCLFPVSVSELTDMEFLLVHISGNGTRIGAAQFLSKSVLYANAPTHPQRKVWVFFFLSCHQAYVVGYFCVCLFLETVQNNW